MALAITTNGPARVTTDGNDFGVPSVDGITITIYEGMRPIYTDQFGPDIPTELIRTGQWATVSGEFVVYDATEVRAQIQKRSGAGTAGTIPTIGELMYNTSRFSSLSIASPKGIGVYTFPRAFLQEGVEFQLSTLETKFPRITWICYPNIAVSPPVLYTIS